MIHKKRFIAALAVVFVSGAVIGVVAGFGISSWFGPRHGFPPGPPPTPEQMNAQLCEKLAEDLELDKTQKTDLDKKLPPALSSLFEKHMKMRDDMKNTIESVLKSITPALSEKQFKLLEEHQKKHDRQFGKNGPPPPPPPDGDFGPGGPFPPANNKK